MRGKLSQPTKTKKTLKNAMFIKKWKKVKLYFANIEFHDELLNVVKIQDRMEKNQSIYEQQVTEIDELHDKICKVDEVIEGLKKHYLKEFLEKMNRLRDELECKQDLIIQEESETNEIFWDLRSKREEAIYQLNIKGAKLVNLGEPKTKTDAIKESNNLGQSSWWCNVSFN